jgi:serine/threonine-protein kinase RsbT
VEKRPLRSATADRTPGTSAKPLTPSELEEKLFRLLTAEVPEVLATSILRRAKGSAMGSGDPSRLLEETRTGVRLFVEREKQARIYEQIDALAGPQITAAPERITVSGVPDVAKARLRAREIAKEHGSSAFAIQRASTVVSELARNIALYAGEGSVELSVRKNGSLVMHVRAVDRGPGIADVDAVLAGRFQSKTGLGRGLLVVKRTSGRFSIQSNKGGTIVDADIPL